MLSVENMEPAAAVATQRQALEGLNTLSGQRAALEEALKVRMTAGRWLEMNCPLASALHGAALASQH